MEPTAPNGGASTDFDMANQVARVTRFRRFLHHILFKFYQIWLTKSLNPVPFFNQAALVANMAQAAANGMVDPHTSATMAAMAAAAQQQQQTSNPEAKRAKLDTNKNTSGTQTC